MLSCIEEIVEAHNSSKGEEHNEDLLCPRIKGGINRIELVDLWTDIHNRIE